MDNNSKKTHSMLTTSGFFFSLPVLVVVNLGFIPGGTITTCFGCKQHKHTCAIYNTHLCNIWYTHTWPHIPTTISISAVF